MKQQISAETEESKPLLGSKQDDLRNHLNDLQWRHDNDEEEKDGDEIDPIPTAYERASWFNVMHFIYILKHVFKLREQKVKTLSLDDLPRLGKTDDIYPKIIKLENEYLNYRNKHKTPSLFWPVLKVFGSRVVLEQTCLMLFWIARISTTIILAQLLEALEAGQKEVAYQRTVYLFLLVIISVYANHLGIFQGQRLVSQLRPALIGLMYRKITRISAHSINQVSIGKIINIAANDMNIFGYQIFFVYSLVVSPLVLTAAGAILWSFVGIAALPGILYIICCVSPIQYCLARLGAKFIKKKNAVTDERVKLTHEMIEGIRLLKLYGWNTHYTESFLRIRKQELSLLKKVGYCDYFGGHLMVRLFPIMGSFLIFVTYGLIGGTLTTSKVYSTLSLLVLLRNYLILHISIALRFVQETNLIFGRIIDLLEIGEQKRDPQKSKDPLNSSNGIEFEDFSASWGEELNGNTEKFALKKLNFSVRKGTLCVLLGKVGSGKTTVLLSFLNEVPKTMGALRYSGSVSYVETEPSIFAGTLRSNILFGKPYDMMRYQEVIEAACLVDDFKELPSGDLTEIGERGFNLSGGQKARTSLARALYSNADIYLLDDPLSAVDTKVAQIIFEKAIRGILKDKTVLLVTHQAHFAKAATKVVVLENGELKEEANIEEILKQQKIKTQTGSEQEKNDLAESEDVIFESVKPRDSQELVDEIVLPESESQNEKKVENVKKGGLTNKEKDPTDVGWGMYWYYIKSAGSPFAILIFLLNLTMIEVLYVLYTGLAGYWGQGLWTLNFAMKVLGIIAAAYLLFLILRELLYVTLGLNASKKLHNKMLEGTLGAKVQFFDTTPSGRILNRFSNDVGILDRYILQVQNDMVDLLFYYAALLITIFVIVPWVLIPGFIFMSILLLLFRLLRSFIMQGKSVEATTRSSMYSFFSQTLSGRIAIRTYAQEDRFINRFAVLLNRNERAYSFYTTVGRALGFYCDILAAFFIGIGFAILISANNINTALIGLACSYLLTFTAQFQTALRLILTYITQMTSTARIKAYGELPQEPTAVLSSDEALKKQSFWPSTGQFEFNNIYMKYRENTEHVLNGLSFSVRPGEKIGCVGRTGAGKTSIIQVLFRMVEIDKPAALDSSIRIDGIDTSQIGLQTLRRSISIISQTPFIFSGTIRKNLDPNEEQEDEVLASVLQQTGLWSYISSLPDGLNTNLSNASPLLSSGQKQLLALARVLLQRNKILVLDEATANVDFETDTFIQRKIMELFHEATVFTIAHRLSTVANYDRVMVMHRGQVKELDHPYKLLVNNIGDEEITNINGFFASMVKHTGSKHSEMIFQTSKQNYFNKFGFHQESGTLAPI